MCFTKRNWEYKQKKLRADGLVYRAITKNKYSKS